MDPLSVLSIAGVAGASAKAAWNVATGLHAFFSNIKAVDETVNGLVAEVEALSNACAFVDQRLHALVRDYEDEIKVPRADEGKLWACIDAQVRKSQHSIAQLEAAFDQVQREGTTKLSQAWRQFMINIHAKDINDARNRLRSHTTSLQFILQTLAIEICYLIPKRANQQLRTLISAAEECMAQFRALQQERTDASQDSQDNQTHERDILKVCGDAVSNGESLYAASVAGGSQARFSSPCPSQGNVQQWVTNLRLLSAIEETKSGFPIKEVESDSVVTDTDTSPEFIEEGSRRRGSRASAPVTENDGARLTSLSADEADIDSDDELPVELAQEALTAARASFDSYQYLEADSYLQEALELVRELPANRRGICDTWDVRYMLSVCAYHSQRPADAEAKLLTVINSTSRSRSVSDEQLRQVCDAGHLLSQLYIKLGNLHRAQQSCKSALQGRRRLLGKSHDDTNQSIALMARIYQLLGNDTRAMVYLRLIDDDNREQLEHDFSGLALDADVSKAYDSAKVQDQPDTATVISQHVDPENNDCHGPGSLDSSESVESTDAVELETGGAKELRSANSLSTTSTTMTNPRDMSTFSTSSVCSGNVRAKGTTMSSYSSESLPQSASCIIIIRTRLGEFSVSVRTNLKESSSTFFPEAWKFFTSRVSLGGYDDITLSRREKGRWGRLETYIEGSRMSSVKDLKITINPSTMDFVLEQKKPSLLVANFRVEGTVYAGKETITKIMMFKPGIRRGGLVEVVSLQIREALYDLYYRPFRLLNVVPDPFRRCRKETDDLAKHKTRRCIRTAAHRPGAGVDAIPDGLAAYEAAVKMYEKRMTGEVSMNPQGTLEGLERYALGRRFFITKKGYLGLGHEDVSSGDRFAVVFGLEVPFLPRKHPLETGLSGYNVVGEAYVQDIMNGEVIDQWRDGTLKRVR